MNRPKKMLLLLVMLFICFGNAKIVHAYDMGTVNCYYTRKNERQVLFVHLTLYGVGTQLGTVGIDKYHYDLKGNGTKWEDFSVDNVDGQKYIYNYLNDFGIKFSMDNHFFIIFDEVNNGNTDNLENDKTKACPSDIYEIYYINKKNKLETMFFVCNGYNDELQTDTCKNVEDYISNSNEFGDNPSVSRYSYTASTAFNNVGMKDKTQTNIGEVQKETEEKASDICDENSANYDEVNCLLIKEQINDLQKNLEDLNYQYGTYKDPYEKQNPLVIKPIHLCTKGSGGLKVMQIVGYVLYIMKILVPLILIIMASVDLAKGVITSNEKPNAEVIKKLIIRVLIGIIIFIIPTVLDFLLSFVDGASGTMDNDGKFTKCTDCLLDPFGDCTN